MQEKSERIPNDARSAAMRARLIAAARGVFVERGFAETGTPEIVAAAAVTRGALYHHFADKTALFRAVVEAEAAAVAAAIETADPVGASPETALLQGAEAYFAAMAQPGRARLLLCDGPAVLGPEAMAALDAATGGGALRQGLATLLPPAALDDSGLTALAALLSAGFDRAALAIAGGAPVEPYRTALALLLRALMQPERGN